MNFLYALLYSNECKGSFSNNAPCSAQIIIPHPFPVPPTDRKLRAFITYKYRYAQKVSARFLIASAKDLNTTIHFYVYFIVQEYNLKYPYRESIFPYVLTGRYTTWCHTYHVFVCEVFSETKSVYLKALKQTLYIWSKRKNLVYFVKYQTSLWFLRYIHMSTALTTTHL